MATTTTNLGLTKPGLDDNVDITVLNSNFDAIDEAIGEGAGSSISTITIGTVTTGAAGTNASVTNTGTGGNAVLNFTIPRGNAGAAGAAGANGAPGATGADGASATITIGTVTTGDANASASVTNRGTASAAVLDFVIPCGTGGSGTGSTSNSMPTVYCWGDSLTEGVDTSAADGTNTVIFSYTDVIGNTYPCINLGCRGEMVQGIMARQGADPMVVGGFTIPADSAPVVIGYLKGNYYNAEERAGIATLSGDLCQPLLNSEAGINPCTIAGVKGRMYRSYTLDAQSRYTYYFKREVAGDAVAVPANTQIITYAMEHYKGGVGVIWMGANGHLNNAVDYVNKVNAMVDYGEYCDYIAIVSREASGDDVETIRASLTDTDGVCHLLYLPELLLERGYTLGGIAAYAGNPDTSTWTTDYGITDQVLLNAPRLMNPDANAACGYEGTHYSAHGNKAIGKLIVEKLGESEAVIRSSGSEGNTPDAWYETDVTDNYGSLAYRLTQPKTGFGLTYDTGFKPYDVDKNWTVVCKFSNNMNIVNGWLGAVFDMSEQFGEANTRVGVLREVVTNQPTFDEVYYLHGGSGDINLYLLDGAAAENVADMITPKTDGWHYVIIAKDGDHVDYYFDGSHIYGWYFTHPINGNYSQKTIRLFGVCTDDGAIVNTTTGTIADFRIYTSYLDFTVCDLIQAEMEAN